MTNPYNDLDERRLRRLVEQHHYQRPEVREITEPVDDEPAPAPPTRAEIRQARRFEVILWDGRRLS